MRYLALATDFDGTLAEHGGVQPELVSVLRRARDAGLRLLLVTGRVWPELRAIFPDYKVFQRIVAENGALLIDPETAEETPLANAPPDAFAERLRERGVQPLVLGKVIVATWEPHQHVVLSVIRELGLELGVIFNKGAVMVLPTGVNKASGLTLALAQLGISPHNCVGVGDAENDHALLEQSELAVAVANAVPMLKEKADWVTQHPRGRGVLEVLDEWLASGLEGRRRAGHEIGMIFGLKPGGEPCAVPMQGSQVLLAGSSGSGKSTLASALLEQLTDQDYQFCVIDPEGDFQASTGRVVMGDEAHAPDLEEVFKALSVARTNVVVNLLGVALEERPLFASALLKRLKAHQEQFGRPHWIVVDEAHHMLSKQSDVDAELLHDRHSSLLLITVHPKSLHTSELMRVRTVVVVGDGREETLDQLRLAPELSMPLPDDLRVERGSALVWQRERPGAIELISQVEPREERRRHRRKYAAGELGDKSFYFRGPEGALNLRANNLTLFVKMADGVDADTWLHHLEQGDYSRWMREAVKDADLADEVEQIERAREPAEVSRARVRKAIEQRYTLPA